MRTRTTRPGTRTTADLPDRDEHPATELDAVEASGHDLPAADGTRPRRRLWTMVLPWMIAMLALAAAIYSAWQWRELAGYRDDIDSARAAAVAFTRDLTNWDASDGLDAEIEALREQGTGPFLDEIESVFGGDQLTSQLRSNGVSATGEVEEVFVQDLDNGLAEVFAVVSVTYDSPETETALQPVTFPATLVMENTDDGGWLIREVTVPNSGQIGRLMAPAPPAPGGTAGPDTEG